MSQPDKPERRGAGRALGAIALIVVGLLVLIPSGLCTATFGYGGLTGLLSNSSHGDSGFLVLALVIGLPFIAVGAGLLVAGIRMWRR